jgi:hypothetical protein
MVLVTYTNVHALFIRVSFKDTPHVECFRTIKFKIFFFIRKKQQKNKIIIDI